MKIDKTNPAHWIALLLFAANVFGAWLLRPLCHRRGARPTVILYGHKLNGNLLAIHRWWTAHAADEFGLVFLTMDRNYWGALQRQGVAVVLATRPAALRLLLVASAVISDHGLHAMQWLVGRTGIWFLDVWHGIPFKGFDADDFAAQHRYAETWVASDLVRELYVHRFGFAPSRVAITGYARTDCLVQPRESRVDARARLGLPPDDRVILFAPTWKQDAAARSLWPFGVDEEGFLQAMAEVAARTGSTVVIRSHLNSGGIAHREHPGVRWLPSTAYPDTETALLASDVLVCDWSSIAFDWLLLDRPAIFLDVPAPFAKGFSLGPEYRYGAVVASLPALTDTLVEVMADPESYWRHHRATHAAVRERVYGAFADGLAAERCVNRLRAALDATRGPRR